MWGVSLRQNQVLEVDGTGGLTVKPPVTNGSDVVLVGHWLEDWDCKHQLCILLAYYLERQRE